MSFNPPLLQDVHTKNLLPVLANGEAYILLRPKTSVTLQLSKRKLSGKGSTILTTHRIVFIKDQNDDFKKVFSSLSVPYSHLEHPLFVQPLLLSNHLKFNATSDRNGAHPFESEGVFKVHFVTGGAQLFLNMFFKFYARFRNNPSLMSSNNPISDLRDDNCAFVDPSDPSHVYFTQPETTQIAEQQESAQPQQQSNVTTLQDLAPDTRTANLMNQVGKSSAIFRFGG
uniref:Uncharacterized protein n=1 Tax=Theileria annulata TaxID=5874 RepID=A0A3B0NB37_THEAN